MNILHLVESYLPARHGMQEVTTRISEYLVKKGHQVTIATRYDPNRESMNINGVEIKDFKISGNSVYGISGEIEQYQNFLLNGNYDIVTCFAAQQWATDIALQNLDKIKGVKVFVPTGFSGFYNPDYKGYFEQMKTWMGKFDVNIFLSNDYRDINFARNNNIKNIDLIPNGASKEEFTNSKEFDIRKYLKIDPKHTLIIHVGSYTGIKGHKEALNIFLNSNIKNSTLLFIGENDEFISKHLSDKKLQRFILPFQRFLKGKKVISKSLSREMTVAAFKEADLFLFPSQLECSPIVLFECMASKTPFLTSEVGNAKEIIDWSEAGSLLPTKFDSEGYAQIDIQPSSNILQEILSNKAKLNRMANSGFRAWNENFTWELIAEKYERTYSELLSKENANVENTFQ